MRGDEPREVPRRADTVDGDDREGRIDLLLERRTAEGGEIDDGRAHDADEIDRVVCAREIETRAGPVVAAAREQVDRPERDREGGAYDDAEPGEIVAGGRA